MARTLEELFILKRTALRYLFARESRLLALGKKPVNKKIANFIRTHQENNAWSNFLDCLNEDLTRNINVYDWKVIDEPKSVARRLRLDSTSKDILMRYDMGFWGGRMTEAPIVQVEQGQLQGRVVESPGGKSFFSFQGIPYAKPPLGSLRFQAPQPPEPWEGVRDATTEGSACSQINITPGDTYEGDENCLYLNVYTPSIDGEFLPVMVYIHGGGLQFGSGSASSYGGDYLVEKDVVVVTFNYRLGALGFLGLNTPEIPGNAGLKDMVMAIRWVKENIKSFGGNAGNVTLFGESAGGGAVSVLTASPLTKNLISKAAIQSGCGLNSWVWQKQPLDNAKKLAHLLGCESDEADDILEFLRATPAKEIVEASHKLFPFAKFYEGGPLGFTIVVEKEFPGVEAVLTESFIDLLTSGRVAEVPIMIGTATLEFMAKVDTEDLQVFIPPELNIKVNSEESVEIANKFKSLYFKGNHTSVENINGYFELVSDKLINVDTRRYVQYLVHATTKPVYYYRFDYVGELNLLKKMREPMDVKKAGHTDELGYLFKNESLAEVEPTSEDIKMRERILRLWTNFAKSGNPTPDENHYITVTWHPVTKDNLYYLNLSNELSLDTNPDKEKMAFWEELYNKYFKIWEHPQAPQPPESWDGFRDATSEANVSAQINPMKGNVYEGDEDCLYLNVYTPNLAGNLPVMFYIHGGGLTSGSGNTDLHGPDYLVEKDVILVTINYRCGALGFLSLNSPDIPGNAGLKDMIMAIRWVKTNIKKFGGNPQNITLFGESAGGVSVSVLTASPLTKNLISGAVIQSGNALSGWAWQKRPLDNAKNLARSLGCESDEVDVILEFLRATPAKEIVEATHKLFPLSKFIEDGLTGFSLVVEKEFPGVEAVITESFVDILISGRTAQVPVMIGTTSLELLVKVDTEDLKVFIPEELNIKANSDEAVQIANRFKSLYFKGDHTAVENVNGYFELLSDRFMCADTQRYVNYLVHATTKPVYYYKFDYVGELNITKKLMDSMNVRRAGHLDELGYLFKNDSQAEIEPTSQDIKMRERMLRLWTNFAKYGNPTPDENHYITITWRPVTKDNLFYLNLSNELSLKTNPDPEKMAFWESLYSKYYKIWEHPQINTEETPVRAQKLEPEPVSAELVLVAKPLSVSVVEPAKTQDAVNIAQNGIGDLNVIRANDPPEDDLPKNVGVNKFVNFYESLGGK